MTRRGATTEDPTIEFLAPNDTAFGMSEAAEFVGVSGPHESEGFDDEAPRPQWLMAVAGVVVTALVAVGVVAAAPWEGGDSAPAPSTTVPTSSTVPSSTSPPVTTAPPTDEELLNGAPTSPTGWVIDDSSGAFQLTGAYSDPLAGISDVAPMDWMSVWTTPDATAETGRWLAISTIRAQSGFEPLLANSTRIDVNGQPALLTSVGNGGFRLHFSGDDGTPYEMAGFGLALDQIMQVARSVSSLKSTISFFDLDAPGRPLDGMHLSISESVLTGNLEAQVAGTHQVAQTGYFDPTAQAWVNLQRSTETPEAALLATLLITPSPEATALGLPSDVRVTISSGEVRDFVVGTTGDGLQPTAIRWVKDGQILTLTGSGVSASTLIDLATASRPAFAPEWRQLVIDSQQGLSVGGTDTDLVPTIVGEGLFDEGLSWQAQKFGSSLGIYGSGHGGSFGSSFAVSQGPMPDLRTYSTKSATFVVATSAWPGTAVTLRVTVEGVDPVDVPLVQLGDTTTYMAVHGFSETSPFTAELLDANGMVVSAM